MYLIIVSRGNMEGDGGVGDTSGRTVRFVEEILYSNPWNLILGSHPHPGVLFLFLFFWPNHGLRDFSSPTRD